MPSLIRTQVPRSHPSVTIAKARRLVDELTGIIRYLYEVPMGPDDPQFFGYGSILADSAVYGCPTSSGTNGSTGTTREQAAAGAIGEAVERYSAAVVPDAKLVTASYQEVRGWALDPGLLALSSGKVDGALGCKYVPFRESQHLRWVWGYSLTRGKPLLVPAFAVYLPYAPGPDEPHLAKGISTGLACGNTLEEAVLAGICEVVERDATMIMWHSKMSMPRIATHFSSSEALVQTLERFACCRSDIYLVNVTTDIGIPAIVAAAHDQSGKGPAVVVASKASLSREKAIVGALKELAQCIIWVRSITGSRQRRFAADLGDVNSREDHVLWPAREENRCHLSFITAGPVEANGLERTRESDDVSMDIATCVEMLRRSRLEVVMIDITPPDIREVGLSVARTIIPGAHPLYFGRRRGQQGLDRLLRMPLALGYTPRELTVDEINPLPHPFP
jgi:ribosomal protein S12 methylthiotransferase accessory factor